MITIENIRRMHDLLDDANCAHASATCFCLWCASAEINAYVGIVHTQACVISAMRTVLREF